MKNNEEFLKTREEILNNLSTLEFNVERCVEAGMGDPESECYNNIEDLIEQTNGVNTLEELEEIIIHAKNIEIQIDSWLISQGQTTISLSWPLVSG